MTRSGRQNVGDLTDDGPTWLADLRRLSSGSTRSNGPISLCTRLVSHEGRGAIASVMLQPSTPLGSRAVALRRPDAPWRRSIARLFARRRRQRHKRVCGEPSWQTAARVALVGSYAPLIASPMVSVVEIAARSRSTTYGLSAKQ